MKALFRTFGLILISCHAQVAVSSTTWEKQAERLQNISATLLDGVPIGEPAPNGRLSVGLQSVVSALPETNPKIGGKTEKVPSSPVHALPTLSLSFRPFENFALGGWVGGLMPGSEALVGLKAKLSQVAVGTKMELRFNTGTGRIYLPILYQTGSATVEGPIASKHGDDKFSTRSTLWAVTPGYTSEWFWWNILIGGKSTTSKFDIEEDQTSLEFTDDLSDAMLKFMMGASLGLNLGKFVVGGGQLFVPDRLFMPRIFLAYREEL